MFIVWYKNFLNILKLLLSKIIEQITVGLKVCAEKTFFALTLQSIKK